MTEKITPVTKNHNVFAKAVPTAKPARSFALALPAIIVSAAPINMYDICEPKIGIPIFTNCLNSIMYLLFNLNWKYFLLLYHKKNKN